MNPIHFVSVVALLGVACGGENSNRAPVSGTAANVTVAEKTDKVVVEKLAAARCDQEETCKNVGPKLKFASREVCLQQLNGSIGNDLNAYDCPRGLDSGALQRCISAIHDEACETPFDTLSRFAKCRTEAICMK